MDIFERLFGISPDNGSGSLEAVYVTVALVALAVFIGRRRIVALLRDIAAGERGKRQ